MNGYRFSSSRGQYGLPSRLQSFKKLALKTKKVLEFLKSKRARGFNGIDIDIKEYARMIKNTSS